MCWLGLSNGGKLKAMVIKYSSSLSPLKEERLIFAYSFRGHLSWLRRHGGRHLHGDCSEQLGSLISCVCRARTDNREDLVPDHQTSSLLQSLICPISPWTGGELCLTREPTGHILLSKYSKQYYWLLLAKFMVKEK